MYKTIVTGVALIALTATSNTSFSQETNKSKSKTMQTSMESTNKQVIRDLYEKILNQRHLEQANTVIDDNYTGVRGEKGPEGFMQTVQPIIGAFPDIQWHIEELLAEGNKVIVRWKWTGTFKNAFRGISANQKEFTNEAIAIYELSGGKAVKAWMQSDQLGFLVQAGVISPELIPGPGNKKEQ